MFWGFVGLLLAISTLVGEERALAPSEEVRDASHSDEEIDQEIQKLKRMKRGYEARAIRHEDKAERLQFEDQSQMEARHHLELAQENRKKAELLQQEIEKLEQKRRVKKKGWRSFWPRSSP